jgi:hypothetical protein
MPGRYRYLDGDILVIEYEDDQLFIYDGINGRKTAMNEQGKGQFISAEKDMQIIFPECDGDPDFFYLIRWGNEWICRRAE